MRRVHWSVALLMLTAAGLHAQTLATRVGVGNDPRTSAFRAPVDAQGGLVTLRGNTRPEANAKNDRGRVSDDLVLNHMMLQLRRPPEQERALRQFIDNLHDHTSPFYHQWITAQEFGQRYGVSPGDVAKVTDWLESQGFKVNLVYPNQMVVDFTGTAGQIRQALHTEMHHLLISGEAHIANMSDPQIPAALASTVAGVVSLNDFRPRLPPRRRPEFTTASGYYLLVPADLWTIYNFSPAFAQGHSGQGQTIVVIEDSDLYTTQDWSTYRSVFGLASAYPLGSLSQVHPPPTSNCTDPGTTLSDDEATLDVEMATAGAPSAAIELASCADTETTPGFYFALENLVSSGTPPPVVSVSMGASESVIGAALNAFVYSLYQQAVAEGISVFVSAGDQGGASSDQYYGDQNSAAQYGITVSGFTSTPYNVSVGGTDFGDTYEGANSTYWGATNAANYGSALSYIPEISWNSTCASTLIADYAGYSSTYGSSGLCNSSLGSQLMSIWAGSGGASACATGAPDLPGVVSGTCAGYSKPAWQSGFIGNPSDGVRDIPDVSLFASTGIWGHAYTICFSDPNNEGQSCSGTPDTWVGVGGTSASAPVWAAIQSLVNQATGERWGNPNPEYYKLAAAEYGANGSTACNSTLGNGVASDCIFYDVTRGDTDVPCLGLNCYLPSGTYGVLSDAGQALNSIQVTALGSGYTSNPTCTLSGGDGSGASCSAYTTGVVSSLALTSGGLEYSTDPTCNLTGGGGTGASCAAMISTTGEVAEVVLTNFGSGYTSNPTCAISGGGGAGATCTASAGPGIGASLTAAGGGYTRMPGCVISGGGGTGATCIAYAWNDSPSYQPAFSATTGWDFATGIGTVNVSNLVANFASVVTPVAAASPGSLPPFGNQMVGTTSASQPVTLSNTGNATLSITSISTSANFGQTNNCAGSVAAGGSCTINVNFSPTTTGTLTGTLTITDNSNGTAGSTQTVNLTGTGVAPAPVAGVAPGKLNFGNQTVGIASTSQPVTLSNTGNATLTITSISTSANFGQTNTCASSVAAGASCTINVTFTPTTSGTLTGTLTFIDDSKGVAGSTQSVALSGTGQDFSFAAPSGSPTSATVAPGSTATYTLSVTGEGGFNQNLNFTCAGAPSEAACTVSPNALTAGSSAQNITVSVTTTAPSLGVPRSRPLPPALRLLPGLRGLLILAWILSLMAWAMGRRNPITVSRWRSVVIPLASGLLLALALTGCGGGGGGGGGGGSQNPGTPAGTYTLTVTGTSGSGSSALSHSVTLTLTVS